MFVAISHHRLFSLSCCCSFGILLLGVFASADAQESKAKLMLGSAALLSDRYLIDGMPYNDPGIISFENSIQLNGNSKLENLKQAVTTIAKQKKLSREILYNLNAGDKAAADWLGVNLLLAPMTGRDSFMTKDEISTLIGRVNQYKVAIKKGIDASQKSQELMASTIAKYFEDNSGPPGDSPILATIGKVGELAWISIENISNSDLNDCLICVNLDLGYGSTQLYYFIETFRAKGVVYAEQIAIPPSPRTKKKYVTDIRYSLLAKELCCKDQKFTLARDAELHRLNIQRRILKQGAMFRAVFNDSKSNGSLVLKITSQQIARHNSSIEVAEFDPSRPDSVIRLQGTLVQKIDTFALRLTPSKKDVPRSLLGTRRLVLAQEFSWNDFALSLRVPFMDKTINFYPISEEEFDTIYNKK